MSFYSDAQATAQRLIEEKGQAAAISRITGQAYDPVTGIFTPGTTTDHAVVGLLLDYKMQDHGQLTTLDTQIRATDKRFLHGAEGLAIEPSTGDTLLLNAGAEVWAIVNVKAVKPAGTAVLYELQVRR